MKICLISVEIFAWGKFGGFGRATRTIGRELAARGLEVHAVVPRREQQAELEELDGIQVHGFNPWKPWEARKMLQSIDADVFHSCEPSLATWYAQKEWPDRKHVVTFRDPRDLGDWWMELVKPSLSYLQVVHNFLYENNPLVRSSIRGMDAIFTIGEYLVPKVERMYNCAVRPQFLPTPVDVPPLPEKSEKPTVCYMARLDRRKRPELFLDLAEKFPEVEFVMAGKSRDEAWEQHLRERASVLPNLEMVGFVDQFEGSLHAEILSKSWIMVNTATREALPNSYIEAMSYGCAIMAAVNADQIPERFGYHAEKDDFEEGLRTLLDDDNWRGRGKQGHQYTLETFETSRAIDLHIRMYEGLVRMQAGRLA